MNCLGQKMDVIAVVPAIMLIFAENYLFIKLSAKQKIYFFAHAHTQFTGLLC